ncbi:hypothetical protein [Mycobacterium parmense]|uniref:Uncharacterized protein n=1 Tax=Mycobacterium parmense TaxID=185642 RepID=A0A7I7YNG1_9MYCO|nr:hypothetical protein [Mycobacterium parmense]MCV7353655.1 hypothetical protein [Mycobacterium parmense]ORW60080.1 hypothetical protein AWC20_09035 [Mycobacterium parmense]BBZ43405.1 hypothetical protein MPRM_06860 [Mycobacterium parmense]
MTCRAGYPPIEPFAGFRRQIYMGGMEQATLREADYEAEDEAQVWVLDRVHRVLAALTEAERAAAERWVEGR